MDRRKTAIVSIADGFTLASFNGGLTMKSFIFITAEGFTFQPGSESPLPDIENCQVIGFADGADFEDAFKNLIRENGYLLETTFDEITGFEIINKNGKHFYLNGLKKYSIL